MHETIHKVDIQKNSLPQKNNCTRRRIKGKNTILTFLFFCGLILTVFEINIFRKTVIDWKIPMGICLGMGLISWVWLRKYLAEYYNTKNIFIQLIFTICGLGGLFTYSFMAINYYFLQKNKIEIIKGVIIERGHLAKGKSGCGNSYARINIKGIKKELVFPCDFEIDKYKFVVVKLQCGFWGFARIIEQVPEKG